MVQDGSQAMQHGIDNNGLNKVNNNSKRNNNVTLEPTSDEYTGFKTLTPQRKRQIIEYEVARFKKSGAYTDIRKNCNNGWVLGG